MAPKAAVFSRELARDLRQWYDRDRRSAAIPPREGWTPLLDAESDIFPVANVSDEDIPGRGVMHVTRFVPYLDRNQPSVLDGIAGEFEVTAPIGFLSPFYLVNVSSEPIRARETGSGTLLLRPGAVRYPWPLAERAGCAGPVSGIHHLKPGMPGFMILGRLGAEHALAIQQPYGPVPAVLDGNIGRGGMTTAWVLRYVDSVWKRVNMKIRVRALWLNQGESLSVGTIIVAHPWMNDEWAITQAYCDPAQPEIEPDSD